MAQTQKSQGTLESIELNYNENTTYQNFRDAIKALNQGKLIALNFYIRKDRRILKHQ